MKVSYYKFNNLEDVNTFINEYQTPFISNKNVFKEINNKKEKNSNMKLKNKFKSFLSNFESQKEPHSIIEDVNFTENDLSILANIFSFKIKINLISNNQKEKVQIINSKGTQLIEIMKIPNFSEEIILIYANLKNNLKFKNYQNVKDLLKLKEQLYLLEEIINNPLNYFYLGIKMTEQIEFTNFLQKRFKLSQFNLVLLKLAYNNSILPIDEQTKEIKINRKNKFRTEVWHKRKLCYENFKKLKSTKNKNLKINIVKKSKFFNDDNSNLICKISFLSNLKLNLNKNIKNLSSNKTQTSFHKNNSSKKNRKFHFFKNNSNYVCNSIETYVEK